MPSPRRGREIVLLAGTASPTPAGGLWLWEGGWVRAEWLLKGEGPPAVLGACGGGGVGWLQARFG